MKALVQRFLEKDVYIKMLEGTADGIVKEVLIFKSKINIKLALGVDEC